MRTSSSLCSSAISHPSSHTASSKHCYNSRNFQLHRTIQGKVSIPQAVSAVATCRIFVLLYFSIPVSIPQAVSAVATLSPAKTADAVMSFNTASGKRCCNLFKKEDYHVYSKKVSIPQAVSAVATY